MRTARRYIATEIYRTTTVVLLVLLGLFTFFDLIDALDNLSEKFSFLALLYLQALQFPTRLFDLLPIGLLIGAVITLAGLAQRNELVVLRVSGVSSTKLLFMLWWACVPIMVFAALLSEFLTPIAELKSSEISVSLLGKTSGKMDSGYWFREPDGTDKYRIINIQRLESNTDVSIVRVIEYNSQTNLFERLIIAKSGHLADGFLTLNNNTVYRNTIDIQSVLTNPDQPLPGASNKTKEALIKLPTSLTGARLIATELQPDRMSTPDLLDYLHYLEVNHLQTNRHIVALWRKGSYPFTLLVMITLATPIGFVQTRKGGVGAKIFLGILIGITFFMMNQLALNVGMLNNLPPWITALFPNIIALLLAFVALYLLEMRRKPKHFIHAK